MKVKREIPDEIKQLTHVITSHSDNHSSYKAYMAWLHKERNKFANEIMDVFESIKDFKEQIKPSEDEKKDKYLKALQIVNDYHNDIIAKSVFIDVENSKKTRDFLNKKGYLMSTGLYNSIDYAVTLAEEETYDPIYSRFKYLSSLNKKNCLMIHGFGLKKWYELFDILNS